uniref:Uncharacterized protein N19B2.080 n=1 Tax=Trypanosoma brucei TaxID=5691 RepID=Q8WPQ4_9TRYP|nr:hypothetical protein [Trypanosoma brucei]
MKTKRYNVFLRPSITLFLSSSVPLKITMWLNPSYALADKILLLLFLSRLHFHFPSLTSDNYVNYHALSLQQLRKLITGGQTTHLKSRNGALQVVIINQTRYKNEPAPPNGWFPPL